MKKVLSIALAITVIMLSSVTTFAASQNTTTTYVTDAEGNDFIRVNTVVTDTAGAKVSYIAFKNNDSSVEENIVYIDQKTVNANNDPITFEYATEVEGFTGIKIEGGSTAADRKIYSASTTYRTVTVVFGEESCELILPTEVTEDTLYATDLVSDYESFASVTFADGTNAADYITLDGAAIKLVDKAGLADNAVITIIGEEPFEAAISDVAYGSFVKEDEEGNLSETFTVFGKVFTDIEAGGEDVWGGILFTDDADKLDAQIAGTYNYIGNGIDEFVARYRNNDGEFAVQLVNQNMVDSLTESNKYACIFLNSSSGTIYGDVITFEAIAAE